jgi:alkanesulfonate monooxygenase SsuD/methylene tetrahydromethanopterin reductase-like flavin-dependent oxidoreductase (luciferase family)
MTTPDIGVFLPTMSDSSTAPGDVVVAARLAEQLGFESVWAVDQLVAGTGVPIVDSTVALGAAAGATSRVRLAYGVMVLPLRPVVWAAKQVASLQHVSADRVLFGVGVGGDRHELSWRAAGVPREERGRRTDAALAVVPDLIAGKPVDLDGTRVCLAPGATVPPIVVGGMSEPALARAVEHADAWFALPVPPAVVAEAADRMAALAAERGRHPPTITANLMVAIEGDDALPGRDGITRLVSDPDGVFGMPADVVHDVVVTGRPADIAKRIEALDTIGATRVVVTFVAGSWTAQAELLAEAVDLLAGSRAPMQEAAIRRGGRS